MGNTAALAAGNLAGGGGGGGNNLPQVKPLSAQVVHEGFGLVNHANFSNDVYQHQTELVARYVDTGISFQRTPIMLGNATVQQNITAAKASGLKWVGGLVGEAEMNKTGSAWQAVLADAEANIIGIADDADLANLIFAFEGINEPNDAKAAGWEARTVELQRTIWETTKQLNPDGSLIAGATATTRRARLAHIVVCGPAFHDTRLDNSNGQQLRDCVNLGLHLWMERANIHSYAGGTDADFKFTTRIGHYRSLAQFGANYPALVSEGGWHTALNHPERSLNGNYVQKANSEESLRSYMCRAPFIMARHNCFWASYEALDDPNPARDDRESNFGMWRVQSVAADPDGPNGWTPKAYVGELKTILTKLRDPGAAYTTNNVGVRVTAAASAELDWLLTQNRTQKAAGTATWWGWRAMDVWRWQDRTAINVPNVNVTIEDALGSHPPVSVGPRPVFLDLRI